MASRRASWITGAVVSVALMAGAHFEGVRLSTYRDVGGVPTICYGHTKGVKMGDIATLKQCKIWLRQEMSKANAIVRRCIHTKMSINQEAAFTDAVYNAGPKIVCKSTLGRMANAGNLIGACKQLTRWVYAGGKIEKGLVKRRHTEEQVCLGEPVTY